MQRQELIGKIPKFCAGPEQLQAGDILVFKNPPKMRGRGKRIGPGITDMYQGFLNERGGHKDSVHTGFIVDTENGLRLAHLTVDGFELSELNPEAEGFSKYLKYTTSIYRPWQKYQKRLAEELKGLVSEINIDKGAKLAEAASTKKWTAEEESLSQVTGAAKVKLEVVAAKEKFKAVSAKTKWRAQVAILAFISKLVGSLKIKNMDPVDRPVAPGNMLPENVISKESICSRFVAEAYISACNRVTNKDGVDLAKHLMNISSWTLPKTLQAYLYRANFEYLLMPHEPYKVYERLRKAVVNEITRLSHGADQGDVQSGLLTKAQIKGADLLKSLEQFEVMDLNKDLIRKSIALIKAVMPVLKRNTGNHFVTPTSYRRVMAFARQEGIYRDVIENNLHDQFDEKSAKPGTAKLAQKLYFHNNKPLSKLYRNYCRNGLGDNEARFQCEPTFGKWYKLSPARNIALTCSIVGFPFILFFGLSRVHAADKTKAQFISQAQEAAPSSSIPSL